MKNQALMILLCIAVAVVGGTGCTNKKLIRQKDAEIARLQQRVDELNGDLGTQKQMNQDLERSLADVRQRETVLMTERDNLTEISLEGAATFRSGSTRLTNDAKEVIDRIAGVLSRYPDRWLLIEGHADDRPIAEKYRWKYPTNWELSAARSAAVLHYLVKKNAVPPERVKIVGLGNYHPASPGTDTEARAQNRRVVFTIGSKIDIQREFTLQQKPPS